MEHEVAGFVLGAEAGLGVAIGDITRLDDASVPSGSTVFHLAAVVHQVPRTSQDVERMYAVNRDGTTRLAAAAARRAARRFILVSSSAVYGRSLEGAVCGEDAVLRPDTHYGASKAQAEHEAREKLGGRVPLLILRPAVMFGPGGPGNVDSLIRRVLRGWVPLVDGGAVRKSVLSVQNMATIMAWAGDETSALPEGTYNVAESAVPTLRELATMIGKFAGRLPRFVSLPSWLLRPVAALGDVAGAVLSRELPISTRLIGVMTRDSILDVSRIHHAAAGRVRLAAMEEALRDAVRATQSATP